MSVAKYVDIEDLRANGKCFYTQRCNTTKFNVCNSCPDNAVPMTELHNIPEPWRYCNEELPEDEDCYLVTWTPRHKDGTEMKSVFYGICWFDLEEQKFDRNDIMDKYYTSREIDFLAWMPLPYYERED